MIADFPADLVRTLVSSLRFTDPLSANPVTADLHIPDAILLYPNDIIAINKHLITAFGGVPSALVAGPCYVTDTLLIAADNDILHDAIAIASAFLHGMAYAHR